MTKNNLTLRQTLPYILLIGGIVGALCAGILTADKLELLKHPGTHLACDLNPIVACGSVIETSQASAFGFPNTFMGLAGFGGIAVIGAGLLAGATFKRWFWLGLQAGVTFGAVFITWLQFETIFRIHALCPYCMVVWAVMIPMFLYTTLYNIQAGHIVAPVRLRRFASFIRRHHADVLIAWYLIIFAVILQHFWYYWKTLF